MQHRTIAALAVLTAIAAVLASARLFGAEPVASSLSLVRTISLDGVEGRIDHMSITPDGRRLFVAALGNSSVEVVDVQAASRAGSISGLKEPQGVWYIPELKRLAVASGGDGNVRIYDEALKLVAAVNDLDDADNVRYDPQAKMLYVGYGNGALALIDPEKVTKVGDIKLDGHPESFRLETNGNRIFVNVPQSGEIEVIDRSKRDVVTKWPLAGAQSNFPMALDEEHHRLFVGCRKPAKMLVLDTQAGRTVAEVECVGDTDDLFYDAVHKKVYVSGGAGAITVIAQVDPDHYRVLETIKTAAGARTSFFSPETSRLYLAVPHRGSQRAEVRVYQLGG